MRLNSTFLDINAITPTLMDRNRESFMEMGNENLFSTDPFLSLDNDLDDVSEVIRNNLFGEHPTLLFDTSRTPSPQYYRDTNIFLNSNNMDADLVFKNQNYSVPSSNNVDNSYDKEIGEIVSLLQDENPLLSSPGPSTSPQHMENPFASVQIKPEYSMDTSSNEVYDMNQQMDSNGMQYASTSGLPMEYHQMSSRKPNQFNNQYNQFEQVPPQQQAYPTQYMYELPRASSSSAIHGMLGANPSIQQVIVDETPSLIRPLSDQNLYSYSNAPMHHQNGVQFGQDASSSSDDNTKQELIKMLLDMKPGDFERLRSQKSGQKQSKIKASSPTPLDPVRKRSSLQLTTLTTSPPLMVSVGSSPSLESIGKQPVYSPELISPQSSIWREDESDDELANSVAPLTRKGPKTERRTAHNLIEKKYRCSINDRINHLKEMLAPEETKLSKSATLRKAIDHINSLRQHNMDLIRENELLKKSIKALGAEVPLIVNSKYSKQATVVPMPMHDDSSESAGSAQSSNSNSPHAKKQMLNQSRVSLCVFMFMIVMMNPFALLFGPSSIENSTATNNIIGRIPVQHRTLKSFNNDFPFEDNNFVIEWWHRAFTRHALIWLINLVVVFVVLTRLLVYGEPVTDRRSPSFMTFLKCKKQANEAVNALNYKEAQRQLYEALYILNRPLPNPGGIDEFLSVVWQVIRHILNGIWIGRWFSRRRRSKMPCSSVCRSHASASVVYHQLNQLYLLGIDAVETSRLTGINLALSAVNLAESAGIDRDGITHRLRADIYVHASLCTKLCLPHFFGRIVAAYFLQRAKRHVQKSASVDGIEMHQYRWIFHPLSQNFLSEKDVINELLINNRQMAHFPFSQSYISPKPIDRLTSAFKMHLLALLINQLNSAITSLSLVDFVDISQLLLSVCTSDSSQYTTKTGEEEDELEKDEVSDWEASTKGRGDELCTWWAHLISCGLYWKFCDYSHAQKHYALIRKCPKPLLNSNLTLGIGMALCARKICHEDQKKKDFANMVWFHIKESFLYVRKEELPNPRKTSTMALTTNQFIRSLTYEWLLNSMLDVWRLSLDPKSRYWEQQAPSQIRQLYREVLIDFGHSGNQSADRIKVLAFKLMFRLLDGANPIATWKLLSRQCSDLLDDSNQTIGVSLTQLEIIKRLRDDIKIASTAKIVD
ncbi:BHLH domain-containing protein [Aphelenchoides bicaudatus]|nr:BHLH domain-containing protein [Aphelenchoides bicaudatus]